MNYKVCICCTLLFYLCSSKTRAQFYNVFNYPFLFENETSAIEVNNGFIYGFTINTNNHNFHKNILLIKTNTAGSILWSKRYDAGTGISIKLYEMIHTFNDEIFISGETGADNSGSNKSLLLKVNAAGNVTWSKKYNTGNPYSFRGLVQLKDSSFAFSFNTSKNYPGVIQVNKKGDILAAVKFTNRQLQSLQSITAVGSKAEIIVSNSTVADINFATLSISWQKQYNTSNQFTALISSRCKNGDIIYLAGRTYGGLLSGTSRVFRTTSNGNLLWAKNIQAAKDSSGSQFSSFDIVLQNYIHEDINGNIVAVAEDESLNNIMLVFNATGKYLYHHYFITPYNFIAETSNGSFLHVSTQFSNASQLSLISDRFLKRKSPCDSSLVVTITNGTDSAAVLDKLVFKSTSVSFSDIAVSASDVNIKTNTYCYISSQDKTNKKPTNLPVTIIPNPAFDKVLVKTLSALPFSVYNLNGELLINSVTNRSTDISALMPGMYKIVIKNKDDMITKTFMKQ